MSGYQSLTQFPYRLDRNVPSGCLLRHVFTLFGIFIYEIPKRTLLPLKPLMSFNVFSIVIQPQILCR
jgi:hypothetical protein